MNLLSRYRKIDLRGLFVSALNDNLAWQEIISSAMVASGSNVTFNHSDAKVLEYGFLIKGTETSKAFWKIPKAIWQKTPGWFTVTVKEANTSTLYTASFYISSTSIVLNGASTAQVVAIFARKTA